MKYLYIILCIMLVAPIQAQSDEDERLPFRERLEEAGIEYQGFVDIRQNLRHKEVPQLLNQYSLSEVRAQLAVSHYGDNIESNVKSDFIYDQYLGRFRIDLREANIFWTPVRWMDLKVGRQVITWGKGDFLFINDLFPKDYQSFLTGRDLQYLKAPSDAAKASFYFGGFTANVIYTPQFDPDIFPSGERLSFYDRGFGVFRGNLTQIPVTESKDWFSDDEWAWRLKKTVKGVSLAVYGYHGFWKGPAKFDSAEGKYLFAGMNSIGWSAEGNLLSGIAKVEMGYLRSEDGDGTDPFTNNSQWRGLLGFDRDFKSDWKGSIQYYHESLLNYDLLPPDNVSPRPLRRLHMATLRVSKMLNQQKWNLSLFTFYNISETDFYILPSVDYKITDAWKLQFGANIFTGKDDSTYWNQFNANTNFYLALNWSY